MSDLKRRIEIIWEQRADISPVNNSQIIGQTVEEVIALLDSGQARVAEPLGGGKWRVNE